jgi:hypothetical protein
MNSYRMKQTKQTDLFSSDSEQIKQHHLARLKQLCEEFKTKLKAKVRIKWKHGKNSKGISVGTATPWIFMGVWTRMGRGSIHPIRLRSLCIGVASGQGSSI